MTLHNSILTLTALDGQDAPPCPSLTAILKAVSEARGVSILDFRSVRRTRDLAKARWLYCWYCVEYTMKSYPQIARFINKDHSTVYYGAEKVNSSKAEYAADIASVDILLNGGKLPIRRPRKLFPYVGQYGVPFQ
jgi:chromosomal replication initiation ATPase DnaA